MQSSLPYPLSPLHCLKHLFLYTAIIDVSEQYSFFLYYPIALCWDVLARSVLFIQYIQQQFTQFCANAVIGKIASSALPLLCSSLVSLSVSALVLLRLYSVLVLLCSLLAFQSFDIRAGSGNPFPAIQSAYIYAFAEGPATCHMQRAWEWGGGELIYSLQIKSGVENQLVCALFCFYLYRVNILCLSYADPLASWRLF